MPKIRLIGPGDIPTPFGNHVLVVPMEHGFQASGACLRDKDICRLSGPIWPSCDDALREALAWTEARKLDEVLVISVAKDPEGAS